uniref:Interleukin-4 inducing immunoglobulin-binding domain-containing protein n=1 Tax=Schistosoma haematobium TaxID=6185 RepID=A0A095ATA7_SCHHA
MSANSMFLIALLSYTLINHLVSCKYYVRLHNGTNGASTEVNKSVGSLSPPWIPGSVCVPLIHDSKRQPPYWRLYEDVNYSGKDTAIGHGACIDDFMKSGLRRISSIQKCVYKKNETV